ncbi:unnamed protein product, partial [Discosporangium mesarthrocarpum]
TAGSRGGSSNAIPIYTAKQIEGIRAACKVGREVLDTAGKAVRVGVTTDEIDRVVREQKEKKKVLILSSQ